MQLPDDYPEQLADLAGVLFERLRKNGMLDNDAGRIAMEQVEDVRIRFVGGNVYMPKCTQQNIDRRNAEIYREFNGSNHRDLAKRYNLTVASIYDILARERAGQQITLF